MIDLHLHTTASDGHDSPGELVAQLAHAGIRVFAVTDHDTVAALPAVFEAARAAGLAALTGIEITAVEQGRDIHVLGYGFDASSTPLAGFLTDQRRSRVDRLRAFGEIFADLGMPFDHAPLVASGEARGGRSVGRAHVARALVAAGHVATVDEAFDRWLAPGRPGFVPRRGTSVRDVVAIIEAAGGLASLAHPLLVRDDGLVARFVEDVPLHALEAYHSEHDDASTLYYRTLAHRRGLLVTGGSDFHGLAATRRRRLGQVTLPRSDYEALRAAACRAGAGQRWPSLGTA